MNSLFLGLTLWSFRKELMYVAFAFLIVLMLPVIAIFILMHTGINTVSDTLVGVDSETRTIQIKDPSDGSIVAEIQPEVSWPVSGVITLEFAQSSLYQPFHTGIDIANANGQIGDPIHPAMNGTVTYTSDSFWGYGKHVIVDHGNNVSSVYAHLNRIYVHKDQDVTIYDLIGTMGSTGWSTGPHLHFETRVYGIPVNPRVFLGEE